MNLFFNMTLNKYKVPLPTSSPNRPTSLSLSMICGVITLLSTNLAFRKDDLTVVYVDNVPDFSLSRVHEKVERMQSTQVARECVRHVHMACDFLIERDAGVQAPVDDLRDAISKLLINRYDVVIRPQLGGWMRVQSGAQTVPATVMAVLSRLRLAYQVLINLGIRTGNPLDLMSSPSADLQRYKRRARQQGPWLPLQRRPSAYYRYLPGRINKGEWIALHNDSALPQRLRAVTQQAHWSLRDQAILEILVAGGPRVTEVCEMTWGGMPDALAQGLDLHTKGSQRAIVKHCGLTIEAEAALTRYLIEERPAVDPHWAQFVSWSGKSEWSLIKYKRYLATQPNGQSTPVFLTAQGRSYSADTYRRQAWQKLKAVGGLLLSPHHLRHWYVGQELESIINDSILQNNELECFVKIQAFVNRMGWASWKSLENYDHVGVASALLKRYDQRIKLQNYIDHGPVPGVKDLSIIIARRDEMRK